MALNKREKVLAGVTGGLLAVVGVAALVMLGERRSAADLRREIGEKQQELDKLDAEILRCEAAVAYVHQSKAHALPLDSEKAHNTYQEWLRQVCSRVQFGKNIDPGTQRPIYAADKDKKVKREIARVFPYQIKHEATLDQLAQFLYEFYSAGYLHKITSLDVSPVTSEGKGEKVSKESLKLAVKIDIEALAIGGAPAGDKSKLAPERPPLEKLEVYRKDPAGIVQRNLFAVYEPPKPPPVVRRDPPRRPPDPPPRKPEPPPKPKEFDHATEAYVTAIVEVDGRPQVWLDFRTTGDHFQRFEGESFESERSKAVRGKIVKIGSGDVIVELGGKLVRVDFQRTLRQGEDLQ